MPLYRLPQFIDGGVGDGHTQLVKREVAVSRGHLTDTAMIEHGVATKPVWGGRGVGVGVGGERRRRERMQRMRTTARKNDNVYKKSHVQNGRIESAVRQGARCRKPIIIAVRERGKGVSIIRNMEQRKAGNQSQHLFVLLKKDQDGSTNKQATETSLVGSERGSRKGPDIAR